MEKAKEVRVKSRKKANQKLVCFKVKKRTSGDISDCLIYLLKNILQLYNKRKNVLKGKKKKWEELGALCMTEESEAEEEIIHQHPLKWRSEGKTNFARII